MLLETDRSDAALIDSDPAPCNQTLAAGCRQQRVRDEMVRYYGSWSLRYRAAMAVSPVTGRRIGSR